MGRKHAGAPKGGGESGQESTSNPEGPRGTKTFRPSKQPMHRDRPRRPVLVSGGTRQLTQDQTGAHHQPELPAVSGAWLERQACWDQGVVGVSARPGLQGRARCRETVETSKTDTVEGTSAWPLGPIRARMALGLGTRRTLLVLGLCSLRSCQA